MSTRKLSTKLCQQNEFDQIRCRRSVYRQSLVDEVSVDKTHCRQMICNSFTLIHRGMRISQRKRERCRRRFCSTIYSHTERVASTQFLTTKIAIIKWHFLFFLFVLKCMSSFIILIFLCLAMSKTQNLTYRKMYA